MATKAKVTVSYDDGTEVSFNPNRPRLLLDMEARWEVQSPERVEHVTWLAHHAVGGSVPYDEWIDTVASIDTDEVDSPPAPAPAPKGRSSKA